MSYSHFDKNGVRLELGQTVTAQHCTGRYGQVAQVTGKLIAINRYHQVTIDTGEKEVTCIEPGFMPDRSLGEYCLRGHHEHRDFEHGHEKWIAVILPAS